MVQNIFQMVSHASPTYDLHYFDANSLYPFSALTNRFVVVAGIRLIGVDMLSRLPLDLEKGHFFYADPQEEGKLKACDGMIQVTIGLEPENHEVNRLPFLPIRLSGKGQQEESFQASCYTCLVTRQKSLYLHDRLQRRFCQVYTMNEVAYVVCKLNYTLYAVDEALV